MKTDKLPTGGKSKQALPTSVSRTAKPVEADITLEEYCIRKSETDKRVALIAGFHHFCGSEGMFRGSRLAFDEMFETFAKLPA